jgi:sialate O-acetylesterase
MDLNGGAAWGFFLRFCRRDVAKKHLRAEDYLRPEYLLPEA